MEKTSKLWIDALIVIGMVVLVFVLCQPIGRKWDEQQKYLYSDEEGVLSPDLDTYFYLRKAKEFTEKGVASIRVYSKEDSLRTPSREGEETGGTPMLLSALVAITWFFLNGIGIRVGVYAVGVRFCSFVLATCTVPLYLFLRKRISRLASVVGALFLALAQPSFMHAYCGFCDTE